MSGLPNQIVSKRAELLVQIAKCRRLAKEVDDQETQKSLLALAAEYEQTLIGAGGTLLLAISET